MALTNSDAGDLRIAVRCVEVFGALILCAFVLGVSGDPWLSAFVAVGHMSAWTSALLLGAWS